MNDPATQRMSRREWAALVLFLVVLLAFGAIVELRSAFLTRRMGDLGCYLRSAWAVRVGQDIYDITEENHWHYNYPPLYAVLMTPLADPPAGDDTPGVFVPYPVSVAIVYLANLICLAIAVHVFATALERHADDPAIRNQPRFCRRWWALRTWSTLICIAPIGHTCMRGQVNLQVLALLCGWMALAVGGRRVLGGVLLAIACCIKVIPLYLLVHPLWRREGRTLAGVVVGFALGLVAIPMLALTPHRTVDEYKKYGTVLFGPLLHLSEDETRKNELLGMNATDDMGIKHAIHNWMYLDPDTRPSAFSPAEEWTYRVLGLLMTLAVLLPTWRRPSASAWFPFLQFSALLFLMVAFSPISHAHYYAFCLPLVMCLLFRHWHYRSTLHVSRSLILAFVWFAVASSVPNWPGLEEHRDLCIPLFGALPLWMIGVCALWRCNRSSTTTDAGADLRVAA
jgi:alpha-1,2-mannosyltransferase